MRKIATNLKFLESKINTKEKMVKFIENELGLWWPECSAFNSIYALLVISEVKKCLTLEEKGAPKLDDVKDIPESTRKGLIEILLNDTNTKLYLPDNASFSRVCKDYLNSLLYHKRRDLWFQLKQKIFEKQQNQILPFKHQVNFEISEEMYNKLLRFETNDKVSKSKPYFNITNQKENLINQGFIRNNLNLNIENLQNQNLNRFDNRNDNLNLNGDLSSQSIIGGRCELNELFVLEEEKFKQTINDILKFLWNNNFETISQQIPNENEQMNYFNEVFKKICDHTDRLRFFNLSNEERINYIHPYLFPN